MKKTLQRKQVKIDDLEEYNENRNRVFIVSFVDMLNGPPVIRQEKIFQKKRNVYQLIDQINITKIKIYVGDVV